jgi:carboxypeptidase Taq
MEQSLQALHTLIGKIKKYEEAVSVLQWDMRTGAPRKGLEARSAVVGELATEMFKLSVSEDMGRYLADLEQESVQASLSEQDRKLVADVRKEYDRSVKIPPDTYQAYVTLTTHAESIWEEAKEQSDFAMFAPYLEKIVAFTQEFVKLWGYEGHPYNTLLDLYEPGMTVDVLDQVFGELRNQTVPLVKEVGNQPSPDSRFLKLNYDTAKQKAFSAFMLHELGFDFDAGRLDESAHPFATGLNHGDVRITTKYNPNDVAFGLFGTIHECGHALYEQNISEELAGTPLHNGASMGIHESQSRFWEIFIGSSRPFWDRYLPELQKWFPDQLSGVDAEQFYKAINVSKPSLIRIEADELTYNLHIMIRYELEKALIGGDIQVADLPKLWNEKVEEYLGITPRSDAEGVLQDVHWAGGAFGYFPSYSLGNMYAAQMIHALRKSMPDLDERIAKGELAPIKQWLVEHVHRFGKLKTPDEIIRHVSGEPLNPTYLVQHLKSKYGNQV